MKHIHVAAAIMIENDRVFIAKRKDAGELALKWEFPGGKIEEGESGEAAVIREIREELGVDIEVEGHFVSVSHTYSTFSLTMEGYLARITKGVIFLSEHVDSGWVSSEELDAFDWAAADIPIMEKLKGFMKE